MKWQAVMDHETCPACADQHDLRRKKDGVLPPHPACTNPNGCRCVLVTDEIEPWPGSGTTAPS